MIEIENRDSVRVIKLTRGVTNALNPELVEILLDAIKNAENDRGTGGVVLSSSNEKFFSIGFDLPHLYGLGKKEFLHFYRQFNRLCRDLAVLPKPVVAAITGHATAGGCILALCGDVRVMADGRKLMGLNEVKLGVPVPELTVRLLNSLVNGRIAREVMEGGEFFPSSRLLQMGMVDRVVPLREVLPVSLEYARTMGSLPVEAFKLIKTRRVETLIREAEKYREQDEENFMRCWFSEESRVLLKIAMEKF